MSPPSTSLEREALPAIEKLLLNEENQLFEELGTRVRAIEQEPQLAGQFEPKFSIEVEHMGALDDLRALGRRIFDRWQQSCYELVCGSDSEDSEARTKFFQAIGLGESTAAATLCAILVSQVGVAPAIAAVISGIVIKRFFFPAHEEFCEMWKAKLGS